MAATASQSQPNGVPSSSSSGPSQSQPTQPTQTSVSSQPPMQAQHQAAAAALGAGGAQSSATTHAPMPREARTIELLLKAQGVTSYDNRVPLLLLDFAYRHTSSVLSDALHLTTDPYTTHAGAKPSASSGAAPSAPSAGDAHVSPAAVNLAIASRQAYQFRGGSGAGGGAGGGASKEWLQELAKERNKHQLPRVMAHEWGVRLPNERFVLSGVGFGLKDSWAGDDVEHEDEEDENEDEQMEDAMGPGGDNAEAPKNGAADEGGLGDMLGDDLEEDEDEMMEE